MFIKNIFQYTHGSIMKEIEEKRNPFPHDCETRGEETIGEWQRKDGGIYLFSYL